MFSRTVFVFIAQFDFRERLLPAEADVVARPLLLQAERREFGGILLPVGQQDLQRHLLFGRRHRIAAFGHLPAVEYGQPLRQLNHPHVHGRELLFQQKVFDLRAILVDGRGVARFVARGEQGGHVLGRSQARPVEFHDTVQGAEFEVDFLGLQQDLLPQGEIFRFVLLCQRPGYPASGGVEHGQVERL